MTTNKHPKPDSASDPAHDDGTSADWSSEGGATTEGPATDQEADTAATSANGDE